MSDRAAMVAVLILDRPTCEDCIATKSGLAPSDLETTLSAIVTALQIHDTVGRCRVCGETKRVLSLDRPIS